MRSDSPGHSPGLDLRWRGGGKCGKCLGFEQLGHEHSRGSSLGEEEDSRFGRTGSLGAKGEPAEMVLPVWIKKGWSRVLGASER